MKIETVLNHLASHGFTKKVFTRRQHSYDDQEKVINILPFDHIYINTKKSEIYIIEEKDTLYSPLELEQMNNKILTFIQFLSNQDPIKYNINLLLLCPYNKSRNQDELNHLLGIERSKFTCRKLFLDTSALDFNHELSILPSFPLNVELSWKESGSQALKNKVQKVIHDDLYTVLIQDEDDDSLDQVLLSLKKGMDETYE